GNERSTTAVLRMKPDYTPLSLEVGPRRSVVIAGSTAAVTEDAVVRSFALPERYFTIFGSSPFAVQMAMMRYWKAHGKPATLQTLRSKAGALPIRIELAGHDSITVGGHAVLLDRYNIANL